MVVPTKIWLYRITHIDDLSYILKHGIYSSTSPKFDPDYKNIGDTSLINYRKNLDACDPPGGKLSEYVPFYLGPRSPMLYQIAKGYEDIPKQEQQDIIYLISSFNNIVDHGLPYFLQMDMPVVKHRHSIIQVMILKNWIGIQFTAQNGRATKRICEERKRNRLNFW